MRTISKTRVFLLWFVTGFIVVLFGTPNVDADMRAILDVLATPGVLLSLPIVNAVPSPLWAVGSIGVLNGIVYGLVALLVFHSTRKWKRRKRETGTSVP